MKKIYIKDIFNEKIVIDSKVMLFGWVKNKRDSKGGFSFIDIYDGSHVNTLQIIVRSSVKNYNTEILYLTTGCSIQVCGNLIYSKGDKQKYEVMVNQLKIIGWVDNPDTYPISSKNHSMEYLREVSHLRPRTNIFGIITRIRNYIFNCLHQYFYSKNFLWIPTPIITELNAEGAGDMFKVSTLDYLNLSNKKLKNYKNDFFGKKTYLTVSGQLTLETYACAMSKVYTFGPTFRAELSNTSRHLSEFWMCEVEKAFSNLENIIYLAESLLKTIVKKTLVACHSDITFIEKYVDPTINKRLNTFIEKKFIQINYSDAITILKKSRVNFDKTIAWGQDLSTEHERYLVEQYFLSPIIIKNYPKELKAFYMRLNNDEITVAAMDILVPCIGEIIGGSEREERIAILDSRLLECKLQPKKYWWYRDLRKYGSVPHSGFGMGFERLLCYIVGLKNVKDAIPFPRTVNNSNF